MDRTPTGIITAVIKAEVEMKAMDDSNNTLCFDSGTDLKVATMTNTVAAVACGVFVDEEEEKESTMEGRKPPPMMCETPSSHEQHRGEGCARTIGYDPLVAASKAKW